MNYRHEYKHYLNYMDYLIIKSRLKAIIGVDEHAGQCGEYKIRSLYFDNFSDKALKEKLNGLNEREKFRIRYYNGDSSYIKLEKKSKINSLSSKRTVMITKEEVEAIQNNDIDWMAKSENPLFVDLYAKMHSQLLRPKTIVDYVREPFIYAPGNVRVTIDRDIRTGILNTDLFNTELPTVSAGDAMILLEVKYDNFIPEIITDIVQLGERRATAYSKYATCRMYG
jgi:hypothetical protein